MNLFSKYESYQKTLCYGVKMRALLFLSFLLFALACQADNIIKPTKNQLNPQQTATGKMNTKEDTQIYFAMPLRANELEKQSIIQLEKFGDYFTAKIMINDKGPYNFLIDTGMGFTTITPALAKDLKLRHLMQTPFTINDTQSQIDFYRVNQMKIGDAILTDYDVVVFPEPSIFSSLTKLNNNIRLDGILGFGAFYNYILNINFKLLTMSLVSGKLDAKDVNTFEFSDAERVPIINILFKDKKRNEIHIHGLVDTGYMFEFKLPPTIASIPFKILEEEKIQLFGLSYSNEKYLTEAKIEGSAYLGNQTIVNPKLMFNKGLYQKGDIIFGIVGISILKNFTLSFDQKINLIKIEKN